MNVPTVFISAAGMTMLVKRTGKAIGKLPTTNSAVCKNITPLNTVPTNAVKSTVRFELKLENAFIIAMTTKAVTNLSTMFAI